MTLYNFFNMLQLIGGLGLAIAYIPQIRKILKRKSVRDFSLMYLGFLFAGIVLMEAYAIYMFFFEGQAAAFFVTNTAATILSGTEFFLVCYFWNRGNSLSSAQVSSTIQESQHN